MIKIYNNKRKLLEVKYSTFPAGEVFLQVIDTQDITDTIQVKLLSADSTSIMKALLLPSALKALGAIKVELYAPYMPYSRQDRITKLGESDSLLTLTAIFNSLYDKISTLDLHNPDATPTIVNRRVDYNAFIQYIEGTVIVSPDKGAVNRCLDAAQDKIPVAILDKVRTLHGITQKPKTITDSELIISAEKLLIVDDICDGGATFLAAAKVLKTFNPTAELHLLVTHGIFSQGLTELEKVFTTINCVNPYKESTCSEI